jgi:hypothetical protein
LLISCVRQQPKGRKPQRNGARLALIVELLEDRTVPSTFSVLNLQDNGAGSLRQAMLDANANAGADVIDFDVAGTIHLTTGALPAMNGQVDIDGTSADGFAGTPILEINYNGFAGLRFNAGAAGSALRSLSLVNAGGAGVTVNGGGSMFVTGNFIGLGLDGMTVVANRGNGLELNASSGNTIGGTTALDRNIISGNLNNGIFISGSANNQVVGNYIGTDVTGTLDRGNTGNGIFVTGRSTGTGIGGPAGNVISGNDANGVYINGRSSLTTVSGNFIGLNAAGNAALGNQLDGVKIEKAGNNLIGHSDPVTGVTFNNTDSVPMQPVSAWQGIRGSDTDGQYLIVGTSGNQGLLFDGTIAGVGLSYAVNYPGAASTSVYGPDNLDGDLLRLVGSYKNADASTAAVAVNGFLFEGTTDDLANSANYRTIDYPGARFNYVHSTMGGFAVGNYDSPVDHGSGGLPLGPGHAYIYNIAQNTFPTDIVFPGSKSNTAYGIWHNGHTSYTIVGGYSLELVNNLENQDQPIGKAYMVDYDSVTGVFSNWASFDYPNGTNYVTHFEGISSVEKGVYTLNADSAQSGSSNPVQGSWATVRRNADGTFGKAVWVDLNYPGVDPAANVTSSNAVFGNQVVGVVIGPESGISYQATVNIGFQLSNVISGNGGNGISLHDADDNQVAMNFIGTDVTGTVDLGNSGNGILVTDGAERNLIGGSATDGNDPTNDVFARPPQGNLISGNDANGVLVTGKAAQTTLSGNFIGTNVSGNFALGNSLDGVAVVNARDTSLIGCTLPQDPFVFYNVISGNGGNGLRVTDSKNTTIQANFFGIGADNDTAVGNALNGVVIEGNSSNTLMGGPIPLGNVVAANGQNGIVVRDRASDFTSYNTFCGLAAFSDNLTLGNGLNGMLITSRGSNILIRTNVITSNGDNGIEVAGKARGVRVVGNIIGLNTNGTVAMGNVNNGVEVGGMAKKIVIGGPQPTFNIIPQNTISANGGNGVAVVGHASETEVNSGFFGTNVFGNQALGNGNAGVFLGAGSSGTTVGSVDPSLLTVISGNLGNGVEIYSTSGNSVVGSTIGTDRASLLPLPNAGNGIQIINSSDNLIGTTTAPGKGNANKRGSAPNLIAFNASNGVLIDSGVQNGIIGNSIHGNGLPGIDLLNGANQNQAPPVLTSVVTGPFGLEVSGTLSSMPNTHFTIEYFANDANQASGRFFLGNQRVQTNGAGVAAFTFFGPVPPGGASFITATATDANWNTSEFSAVVS